VNSKYIPVYWQWKTLEEVCEEIYRYPSFYGMEHVKDGIPVVRGEHINDQGHISTNWDDYWFVNPEVSRKFPRTVLQEGDLVFTVRGTIGKVGLVTAHHNDAQLSPNLIRISPSDKIVSVYLWYFLQSLKETSDAVIQNAVTIAAVRASDLGDLRIPLPPLPEQRRIAAILARADRLRRLRRTALQLSDSYLQSVFIARFGDPVTNPMGWDVEQLRDISAKFSDGPFGSNLKTEHYTASGVRVIRLQNIGVGELIDTDKAYISKAHFAALEKHRCIPGDVLVGTLGDPNLRACILPESITEALNKADCVQIRVDAERADNEFVCWLLNLPHTLFLATRMIHGQTRERISMGQLAELRVPIPPLPLQQRFAGIAARYERLRAQEREALRQAEHLFDTLLHRAFRGELGGGDRDEAEGEAALLGEPSEVAGELVQMGLGLE